MRRIPRGWWSAAMAVGAGAAYGIVAQLTVRADLFAALFGVMSFGYIFLLPVALGAVAVLVDVQPTGWWRAILQGLFTVAICMITALLVGWEGTICVVAMAPIYFPLAVVGAILGKLLRGRALKTGPRNIAAGMILFSPLASASLEAPLPLPEQERVVESVIVIDAPKAVVWQQIIRVPPIHEEQESFFFSMGFPKPIEATLSHEGVGGVRHASFERDLLFIETVNVWEPERRIAFRIEVDPTHTPTTTLDEHVTVGGRYFDVLQGEYRLEDLGHGRTRLYLSSRHRISTRFNFYTSLWSDFLMRDIQENILRVVRARAQAADERSERN